MKFKIEDFIRKHQKSVLFAGNGENADDLFQIGCIGLIKAIDNFDITQNVKFSTYAVPTNIRKGRTTANAWFG